MRNPNLFDLVLLVCLLVPISYGADENCKFNNYEGRCISILSCPFALALLKIKDKGTLNNMVCGFENNPRKTPKICCPVINDDKIVYPHSEEETSSTKSLPTTTIEESLTTTPMSAADAKKHDDFFPNRSVCGLIRIKNRIHGGSPTAMEEFPWLVRLMYEDQTDNKIKSHCAGSLITDRHVITAAHCLLKRILQVRLGDWDIETEIDCQESNCIDPPVERLVAKSFMNPSFNVRELRNGGDIAVLELNEPVTFTDSVRPVCLPNTDYTTSQDYDLSIPYWAAGWGLTEFDIPSAIKRKVQLDPVSINICVISYNLTDSASKKLICAGGKSNKDTCAGDSGSALVKAVSEDDEMNWFLYGITSFGKSRCGVEGTPALYTRITSYMDWIKAIVQT